MNGQKRVRKRHQNRILSQEQQDQLQARISASTPLVGQQLTIRDDSEQALPLTPAQHRLWTTWQIDKQDSSYNLAGSLHFLGQLEDDLVQQSFAYLVGIHGSLRTRFFQEKNQVLQKTRLLPIFSFSAEIENDDIDSRINNAARQPFDLCNDSLLRVIVIKQSQGCTLLVVMHHIITDGTSMQQLLNEFIEVYKRLKCGLSLPEEIKKADYLDYAAWLQQQDYQLIYQRQTDAWLSQLGNDFEPLKLPSNNSQRSATSYHIGRHEVTLDKRLWSDLKAYATMNSVTPYLVFLTAWQYLLHRYSEQTDIKVGVPIANRHLAQSHGLVGFFVNTQVIRLNIAAQDSFIDLLLKSRAMSEFAQSNQDLPLERLLEAIKPERLSGTHPLFQVMFNYLKRDKSALASIDGLTLQSTKAHRFTMPFDLQLDVIETIGADVELHLFYAKELFEEPFTKQCLTDLVAMLSVVITNDSQVLHELSWYPELSCQKILTWSAGDAPYSFSQAIPHIISQVAQDDGHKPALLFAEQMMDYSTLEVQSNQLAHYLISHGAQAETLIGVCMDRSFAMVVSLLAILKAGAGYVPLDANLPLERLNTIVTSSQLIMIIADQGEQKFSVPYHLYDKIDLTAQADYLPEININAEQCAYVIYTSGSTGEPKGVANTHQALYNRITWQNSVYPISATDKILQKTPFGFDVSVWEFFWPLMQGAQLIVAEPDLHKDPKLLSQLITRHQITVLHFVPSMLQAFISEDSSKECTSIKHLICSGEVLPAALQYQVLKILPGCEIHNLYGPTEAAIDVSYYECHGDANTTVPIGKPIAGCQLYVLDKQLNLSPMGALGELYIGGIGLARGYVGRTDLTAERFVANPFSDGGSRLYRSGDLVRWNMQGQLEYLGRTDHQVKIRGLRIELGEVEAQLQQLPQTKEAVVITADTMLGKRLIAYVSLALGDETKAVELQELLAQVLPDYMVPSHIEILSSLPLNNNGKVDRKALPKVELQTQQNFVAPEGDVEEKLAVIWQQVLRVENVGRFDNFFALGGDSIISLQIIAQAKQVGIAISAKQMFELQTISALSVQAEQYTQQLIPQQVSGDISLLPMQSTFLSSQRQNYDHYNQAIMLSTKEPIHYNALVLAFQAVINKHDVLRTRFEQQDNLWQHDYLTETAKEAKACLVQHQVTVEKLAPLCELLQASLSLSQGRLQKLAHIKLTDGTERLLWVIHHLVVDGVSWRILLEDLQQAYQQALMEKPISIGLKTYSVQAWAEALQEYPLQYPAELHYWQNIPQTLASLPVDHPSASTALSSASEVQVSLTREQTQLLLQQAGQPYRTHINELLLSGLSLALQQWTGASQHTVFLEGHGRNGIREDLDTSQTVGWFTSRYPVRICAQESIEQTILSQKSYCRAIPNHGVGYGALLTYGEKPQRDSLLSMAQPQIEFNYLGQFDTVQLSHQWQLSNESVGPLIASSENIQVELAINAQVNQGQLIFSLLYSRARFDESTIIKLQQALQQNFARLIDHCIHTPDLLTPEDLPLVDLSQQQLNALPIKLHKVEKLYPLSPMQQGMMFHSMYQQGSAYINQLRIDIHNLNPLRFKAAWKIVQQRHDVLRTGFLMSDDLPLQYVLNTIELPYRELNWQGINEGDLAADLTELAQQELTTGFSLDDDTGLSRLLLINTSQQHHFIWTYHHILLDGWSSTALMAEVLMAYQEQKLAPINGQYSDYITYLQKQDPEESYNYWQTQVDKLTQPSYLSALFTGDEHAHYSNYRFALSEQETEDLVAYTKSQQVTSNTLIQGAWALLLARLLNQSNVCFGATTSGRPVELKESDRIQGLFINTLPVISEISDNMFIDDWLRDMQMHNVNAREFEHTPLYEIQRLAERQLALGQHGLFDTLIIFENYPVADVLMAAESQGTRFDFVKNTEETNYPVTVFIETGKELAINIAYQGWIIPSHDIELIAQRFKHILQQMVTSTKLRLADIAVLNENEAQHLLALGQGVLAKDSALTVFEPISKQVQLTPNAVAIRCEHQTMTYLELEHAVNKLACFLIGEGIEAEEKVGVIFERGIEMVISLLAIMKAGAVYVPIDPTLPHERRAYIVEQSNIKIALTNTKIPLVPSVKVLNLAEISLTKYHNDSPKRTLHGEQLAYTLYTSGSTGQPKGVAITHANLINFLLAMKAQLPLPDKIKLLAITSLSFDISGLELYLPLLCGGEITIAKSLQDLTSNDVKNINLLQATPAGWRTLLAQGLLDQQSSLIALCGGEALPADLSMSLRRLGVSLWNMYGPTETTIWSSCDEVIDENIQLGQAICNTQFYVLDQTLSLSPKLVAGELYIAGAGLARGYLNRPDLSAERFIANPFLANGSRLYRTGDLVRWNTLGQLEYLGRTDHQIKIRGYRIELGEIETQLMVQTAVEQAVVVADEGKVGTRLVAYVVGKQLNADNIRHYLAERFPDYMVPNIIMVLPVLPLNSNGKIDRKSLPAPETQQGEYISPIGETEMQLATIWQAVLEVEKVSRTDNFFTLGGDSISSLRLVAQAKKYDVPLSVADIFSCKDLQSLALKVAQQSDKVQMKLERSDIPYQGLSYAQERQWVLWKLAPDSDAYHITSALMLTGSLNKAALQSAFDYVLVKHASLRTLFIEQQDSSITQVVQDSSHCHIEELLLVGQQKEADDFRKKLVKTPFDLTKDSLLRVGVITHDEHKYEVIIVMHHIISDGWSLNLITNDFVAGYLAAVQGDSLVIDNHVPNYSDYAKWQKEWLAEGEEARQLAYWQSVLGANHPTLSLPADLDSELEEYTSDTQGISVEPVLKAALESYAQQQGVTLFVVLMSAWHVLLHRYSGQAEIRVGMPIANRQHVDSQEIVGFFVNTQVLCSKLVESDTLTSAVQQIANALQGAQANQDLPFEKLLESLNVERTWGQQPLFQVMMNHQRLEENKLENIPDLLISEGALPSNSAQFSLILDSIENASGQLTLNLNYAVERFSKARISTLLASLQCILENIVAHPQSTLAELQLLPEKVSSQLASLGQGDVFTPYQTGVKTKIYIENTPMSLPELAPQQYQDVVSTLNQLAEQTPNAQAITCAGQSYTFKELYDKSSQLAYYLRQQGVSTEQRVGVALARSRDLPVAFLAILKAGAVYVPMDLSYPEQRLAYMIQDSGMAHILVSDDKLDSLAGTAKLHRFADIKLEKSWQMASVFPAQGAYVIYTSGSTGKPKGVLVSRDSIGMHVRAIGQRYGITAKDRELIFMSFCFDGAHERWLTMVTHGGTVVIRPEEQWDLQQTYQNLHEQGVSVVVFPPVFLRELAVYVEQVGNPPPVRVYCFGGDAMPQVTFELAQRVLKPDFFINGYGPTETVVTPLTWKALPGSSFDSVYAPIGEVLGMRQAWILDAQLNLVLPGMAGELYMALDIGLARGYLNRPELSAERFIANPFASDGSRLYRTGDLVRWNKEEQMEYLGRSDHQVKIRGFRIELGEIEGCLRAEEIVREAVVIADEGPSGQRLIAYVSSHNSLLVDSEKLRQVLAESLPDYMVPSVIIALESLPLNSNGKIDRKALPKVELRSAQEYQAPQGKQEELLASIWQEVLGIKQVGRFDNFFELGGDSILSLQIIARVRQAGYVLTPKQIFEQQTILRLSGQLTELDDSQYAEQTVTGTVTLLPIQADFFSKNITERSHWNQSVMLHMKTAFDEQVLQQTLNVLFQQHDALRLRYHQDEKGLWQQQYLLYNSAMSAQSLWFRSVNQADITALADEAQRSLELSDGPIMRIVHMNVDDGSARLLLVIHHLAVDGVSWRVILDDLATIYQQKSQGQNSSLMMKSHSYQHWAERISHYPQEHSEEFGYWTEQEAVHLSLPNFNQAGSSRMLDSDNVMVKLDPKATQALLQVAPKAYRTQINDLLLSALSEALYQWLGQTEYCINLEGHGREAWDNDTDLSRTVGWFTSLFPVQLVRLGDLGKTIQVNKERLRAIPNKGIGYGAFKYYGSTEQQSQLKHQQLGQIDFNYLGQFDNSVTDDEGSSVWQLAKESGGEPYSPLSEQTAALAINGQVFSGSLQLTISYSREQLHKDDIGNFAGYLEQALQAVINHCQTSQGKLTPSDVPLAKLSQQTLDELPLDLSQVATIYPLSPMQEGMLFHSLYDQSDAYINQTSFAIDGLDVVRFQHAWQQVVNRHDALRTGFVTVESKVLQYVVSDFTPQWQLLDWQDLNKVEQQKALSAKEQEDCQQGFDLEQSPGLTRLTLIQLSDREYHLIWTNHHILTDGWSSSMMMGEVLQAYEGLSLAPVMGQYKDYIGYLATQDKQANLSYWQEQTAQLKEPSYLTAVLIAPEQGQYDTYGISMTSVQTTAMADFTKRNRITVNTLIQGAWSLLLSQYLNRDAVCFGATTSGRPTDLEGSEYIQGMFINTVPVITEIMPTQSVSQFLQAVQATSLQSREHEFTPLYDIQRQGCQHLELDKAGLFDTLIVFENYPIAKALQQRSEQTTQFDLINAREETNYPLTLGVMFEDILSVSFIYQGWLISEEDIKLLAEQFKCLLLIMMADGKKLLSELSLLNKQQENELASLGQGDVFTPYQTGVKTKIYIENTPMSLPELAPQQYQDVVSTLNQLAEQTPNAQAITCAGQSYTFKELYDKSSQLAYYLRQQGVSTEQRVGVALARSRDLPVAFLAILKAGAVYVPMDLSYPEQRLAYMIQDSGMAHILVSDDKLDSLAGTAKLHRFADIKLEKSWQMASVFPAQGAYVIYTSGSTGKPKGVLVSRDSIGMHVRAIGQRYGITAKDRELIFMSFCFDGAHERWLTMVTHGGTVVIRPEEQWDLQQTYQNLHEQGVSVVVFPPVFLRELAVYVEQVGNPPPVRVYCFGGDAMPQVTFELAQRVLKPDFFINGYGPTETVVTPLTWKALPGSSFDSVYAPIGEVLGMRQAWILDAQLNLVLPGMAGELYMALDIGLARGYLNRPELSAERFIANPFASDGSRLYRTGDLVRWNKEEQMEYLGRSDHQVKIRGFRIELGEIEGCLRAEEIVREAVVIADEGPSGQRLIAYVSSHNSLLVDSEKLRQVLAESLPDYMVPSVIIALESLPLNSNGKIDRKALPKVELRSAQEYQAPQGKQEELLASIWQEVLGIKQVGRFDNFFELGGDSIISLKVVNLWQQKCDLPFNVRQLWQSPGLSSLASVLLKQATPCIHQLNGTKDGAPVLFCLHEGVGLTMGYRPLAKHLEGKVQCMGIAPDEQLSQQHTMQQLAAYYTKAMLHYQSSGPFYLVGWSLGGALVLLIADILTKLNHEVKMVHLIDCWNPYDEQSITDTDWQVWARLWILEQVDNDKEFITNKLNEKLLLKQEEGESQLVAFFAQYKDYFIHELRDIPSTEVLVIMQIAYKLHIITGQKTSYNVSCADVVHCWWSSDRPQHNIDAFYKGLGAKMTDSIIDYDHHKIVSAKEVITMIADNMLKL